MSSSEGRVVGGRYRIVRLLGAGGMGEVFEAEHLEVGRRFALKMLSARLTDRAVFIERFRREARAAASVGHPGIVDVVDLGLADDGTPYLVMELLSGESLRAMLQREGTLPEAEAVSIAKELSEALAALHAQGVLHRDLKPDNVFLQVAPNVPRVKVLDFGLAKYLVEEGEPLTATGGVMGTPAYMAPEQIRAEAVDGRTDVYSVGVILFECLTGQAPHIAGTPAAIVAKAITTEPDFTSFDRVASPGLQTLVRSCLAKAPAERPSDGMVLAQALRGLGTTTLVDSSPTLLLAPSAPVTRRRWIGWAVGAVAIAVAAGAALVGVGRRAPLELVVDESFADNSRLWPLGGAPAGTVSMENGRLVVTKIEGDRARQAVTPVRLDPDQDFRIELTLHKISGGDKAGYGIIFGSRGSAGYRFLITGGGSYAFNVSDGASLDTAIPFTHSPAILQGDATNVLELAKEGKNVMLRVNGRDLETVQLGAMWGPNVGVISSVVGRVEASRLRAWIRTPPR